MAKQLRKKIAVVASLAFVAALGAGVYSANVTAEAETDWNTFTISATAVRTKTPSGLRFKVDCPVAQAQVTAAYTKLTLTPSTVGTAKTVNVPATVWRSEGDGWNAVLLDIPSTDYVTEVTAQSFVTVGGTTYETAPVTTSIAKTAAEAIVAGETSELVTKYVMGTTIALDQETLALQDGKSATLVATTSPAGYAVKWTSDNEDVAKVDVNGVVTAVGAGTANVSASIGDISKSCEVTVSYRDTYDFEDGYAPAFLHSDAAWSTNGGSEVAGGAFKTWGDYTYEAFNLDKAYMDWAFRNKFAAVSFDLTVEFDESRGYVAVQIAGANVPNYYFGPGEKQTITITKKMYDAWLNYDNDGVLKVLAQNQDGGMITYVIDNVKATESMVVENFDQFASAYAYNQISDSTATGYVNYVGFFYSTSGSGNATTGFVSDSHPGRSGLAQSKYIVSESGADIANIGDNGAIMFRADKYRLVYAFSMELLDYVFGADASVAALAWDLKHYTDCNGTEQMPIKRYAAINGVAVDPSTQEVFDSTHASKNLSALEDVEYYDYNVWSTCTITRAEYQALKDAGATHIVFRVLGEHASSLNGITKVLLDNFRFVLANNA